MADSGNDRIVIYALNGPKARETGSLTSGLNNPEGVVALPNGDVFATDTFGGAVVLFRGGKPIKRQETAFGKSFRRPHDIDVTPDGKLAVVDSGRNRVVILDRRLRPVAEIGGPGFGFNEPKYLTHDDKKRLWLVDEYNNRLVILSPDRKRIETVFGNDRPPFAKNKLNRPESILIKGQTVWLADTHNDRVLRLRLAP